MSTRSFIGVIDNKDSSNTRVVGVYCHYDGYPDHHGPILKNNYATEKDVYDLISLGDISSLDSTLVTTVAYHRDRGEHHSGLKAYNSEEAALRNCFADFGADYAYLFKDGKWFYAKRNSSNWKNL